MNGTSRTVVLFSTADWDTPYWTNKQHMAVHLAARGYKVLYVETIGLRRPSYNRRDVTRMVGRVRRSFNPVDEVQPNLWVLAPMTIPMGHQLPITTQFNTWQLHRRIAAWLRAQRAARPIVWTYHPYMLQVAAMLSPQAIVYHCVDAIGAMPGVDRNSYQASEDALLESADHIFATSQLLRDRCAAIAPNRTHYFANVTDVAHFAAARNDGAIPADLAAIPRPRLGYVGVLSDFKLDFDLIERVVASNAAWQWVFIGDERNGQASPAIVRLKRQPNVHMLGWRPYDSLPDYLRGIDIALLPHQMNDYTRAMFPMKFFEYLAAGRPIVTTPLPALAELQHLCRVVTSADHMANEIRELLAAPGTAVVAVDDPVLCRHSWSARLDDMLAIIDC